MKNRQPQKLKINYISNEKSLTEEENCIRSLVISLIEMAMDERNSQDFEIMEKFLNEYSTQWE